MSGEVPIQHDLPSARRNTLVAVAAIFYEQFVGDAKGGGGVRNRLTDEGCREDNFGLLDY